MLGPPASPPPPAPTRRKDEGESHTCDDSLLHINVCQVDDEVAIQAERVAASVVFGVVAPPGRAFDQPKKMGRGRFSLSLSVCLHATSKREKERREHRREEDADDVPLTLRGGERSVASPYGVLVA